jgi:hypothetical protein
MANNAQPQQPAPVVIQMSNQKPYSGSNPGLDWRDLIGFFAFGGVAIVNVIATIWFTKYIWAWKLISWMPALGSGPITQGSDKGWVVIPILIIVWANGLNLGAANFQRTWTAWSHMVTAGVFAAATVYALVDYYLRGSLQLTDVQSLVMHSMVAVSLLAVFHGGIAIKLTRRYLGEVGNGNG